MCTYKSSKREWEETSRIAQIVLFENSLMEKLHKQYKYWIFYFVDRKAWLSLFFKLTFDFLKRSHVMHILRVLLRQHFYCMLTLHCTTLFTKFYSLSFISCMLLWILCIYLFYVVKHSKNYILIIYNILMLNVNKFEPNKCELFTRFY